MKYIIKNSLVIIALLLTGAVSTYAQTQVDDQHFEQEREKRSPEERAKKQADRMAEKLDLSEVQTREIEAINLEYVKINDKRREEKKQLLKSRSEQIRSILTEEQALKYDKLKEQRKGKMKKKRKMKRKQKKANQQDGEDLTPE